jgi:hypothetical protein
MRPQIGAASIIKGTNKAFSSTQSEWKGVREGSFFKFVGDNDTYVISQVDPLFYLTEFEKIGENEIKTKGDAGINVNVNDTISISFKEYELYTVFTIKNGGTGYNVGDVLTVDVKPMKDIRSNQFRHLQLMVGSVDGDGRVLSVSISNVGRYYSWSPENKIVGGKGSGAEINLVFKECEDRTIIERDVERIRFDGENTFYVLNYPLPGDLKKGKVGANKYVATLSTNYIKETKINKRYEITKDFTPILGLPMMSKGSLNPDAVYNAAIIILEKKIQELENSIKNLTK